MAVSGSGSGENSVFHADMATGAARWGLTQRRQAAAAEQLALQAAALLERRLLLARAATLPCSWSWSALFRKRKWQRLLSSRLQAMHDR